MKLFLTFLFLPLACFGQTLIFEQTNQIASSSLAIERIVLSNAIPASSVIVAALDYEFNINNNVWITGITNASNYVGTNCAVGQTNAAFHEQSVHNGEIWVLPCSNGLAAGTSLGFQFQNTTTAFPRYFCISYATGCSLTGQPAQSGTNHNGLTSSNFWTITTTGTNRLIIASAVSDGSPATTDGTSPNIVATNINLQQLDLGYVGFVQNSTSGLIQDTAWTNAVTIQAYHPLTIWTTNNPTGAKQKTEDDCWIVLAPSSTVASVGSPVFPVFLTLP